MFVNYINSKTSGAKMPRANIAELKKFEIECPSVKEQKNITDRFDELIDAIAVCESMISRLNLLIKGRFCR
jgi:Type I restriction modification DNA specificity domain.